MQILGPKEHCYDLPHCWHSIALKFFIGGDDRCFHFRDVFWFLVLSFTQVSSPITMQSRNYSLSSIMCLMNETDKSHMKSFEMVCDVFWHPARTHIFVIQFAMAMMSSVPITMSVLSGKGTCMTQWMCMGIWVLLIVSICLALLRAMHFSENTCILHTATIWRLTSTCATPFACKIRYHTVYFDF